MKIGPIIDGYDTPRKLPHVDWISIDDRWPPGSVHVLVLLRNGSFEVLSRFKNEWWPGGFPCDEAVAWVHLPRPPRMTLAYLTPEPSAKRSRPKKPRRGARV